MIKWFSFAFLFFSFIKSYIPSPSDFALPESVNAFLNDLASLRWLAEYQALICFAIAFYGIWLLAQLVREQFAQQHKKTEEQLRSKRAAALAGLPYSLSLTTNYVRACSKILLELHERCQGDVLPKWVVIPELPKIEPTVFSSLRESIEFFPENAAFLSTLMASLQIQNSRLGDLVTSHTHPRETVLKINIEIYLKDTAEIAAQSELLAEFLRREGRRLSRKIRNRDIGHALISLISDDEITIPIIDKYQLTSEDIWVPGYLKM